jgi:hypothetical protein
LNGFGFTFQTRHFYERLGHTLFGTLNDYPPGHSRFFLKKTVKTARLLRWPSSEHHTCRMPDCKPKPDRPTPRKVKSCKTCGRPFVFQKKWTQDWDIIKFCSDTCRNQKAAASDAALEQAILTLLAERVATGDSGKTICPSEAAKLVAGDAGGPSGSARDKEKSHRRDWEALMEPARAAARRLVIQGKILLTQHNQVVDPSTAKGPIRLKLR